jgi:hypothetical protein
VRSATLGREAETERYAMHSMIDPRALRELYLVPFELAVTEGGALGVITSTTASTPLLPRRRGLAQRHPAGRVGLRGSQ